MKITFAPLCLLIRHAFASPGGDMDSSDTSSQDMMGSVELFTDVLDVLPAMEFTGPVTPGGPDMILYGTAEQIYEQIIEVNPTYDVWDFPEYAADLESQGIARENIDDPLRFSMNPYYTAKETLENRASFNCAIGSIIRNTAFQCDEGMKYLRRLGNAWCSAKAKSCNRVSCSKGCGMLLCSKLSKSKRVRCGSVAKDIGDIMDECGNWVAGQFWTRGRKNFDSHNVELSAQDC